MTTKTNCKKEEHKMHMCELMETGLENKNPEKFKEITEKPESKVSKGVRNAFGLQALTTRLHGSIFATNLLTRKIS